MNDILKKLLVYQVPHFYQLLETIKVNNCILDASDTGTGKTYTALALCAQLKKKPFVICPKSVISSWVSVALHFGIEIFGIANYELLKGCKYYTSNLDKAECPYMDKVITKKKIKKRVGNEIKEIIKEEIDYSFQLPNDTMIIFDEAHRCKNYKTATSKLLRSIKKTKCNILLLSATITDKIDCFKPFGEVFGFYDTVKKYKSWMRRQMKMNKIAFKKLKEKHPELEEDDLKLLIIHNNIFPHRGSRMKISELGDLFPKNSITSNSYFCNDYDKVQKEYDIINEALVDLKNKEKRAAALAKIVRARQKIEMFKIPIFIDLAEEALNNKYSVVIFVNYIETMDTLAHHLKTDCLIHGQQSIEDRQYCIDDFQSNKSKVIICIMQAGGVGISLHDLQGGHTRMSIVSPTWSGQDIKQALGRIHRAGSKTPAIQKIVYCAKTYEDRLSQIISSKIKNINMINDKDLIGHMFDKIEHTEILNDLNNNVNVKEYKKSKKKFKQKVVRRKKPISNSI